MSISVTIITVKIFTKTLDSMYILRLKLSTTNPMTWLLVIGPPLCRLKFVFFFIGVHSMGISRLLSAMVRRRWQSNWRAMAQTWLNLTSFLLVVCSVIWTVDAKIHHRRPMILPLHLSSRNHTLHRHVDNLRRHLQQSELSRSATNARMRLYDDLLSNGYLFPIKQSFFFLILFIFLRNIEGLYR